MTQQSRKIRVLIVLAHPEPTSFNAALAAEATSALQSAGHEVRVSDLHAMAFDPVSDRRNFLTAADPVRFDQQAEESFASRNDGFAPGLQAEMDKLAWCDLVIFQFPLWWLGMPAILKGWIDRVFALGRAYGGGRWFANGYFAGKTAMLSVTIGGAEAGYSSKGLYGRSVQDILYPISHGVLAFTGFAVAEPFIVHAPGRMTEAARREVLQNYRERLLLLRPGDETIGKAA
ncbi:NAD(P)H-dependent oxidoreductase [Allosphingosinicella sp.]|uniref:NAD(P)H-dependent oxidoreductase n=1 Tax=Allosphingosinicella sp. TaxID=2823234 RepID=UPI0037833CCA